MVILKGIGVSAGIAFGKLEIYKKNDMAVHRTHIENSEKELKRFENACDIAYNQLTKLYNKALDEVGEDNAMIFDIHKVMLEDNDFLSSVKTYIKDQKINAESAVAMTSDAFSSMFSAMDDSYMQARATDIKDISDRIISILSNVSDKNLKSDSPVIISAVDLTPSETVQLDKSKILAFVTEKGSISSHTSILARTMNIPSVVCADNITNKEYDGAEIIVDGFTGEIYIDPTMDTIISMQEKKQKSDKQRNLLQKLKGVKPITKDGQKVLLYANIGSVADMTQVYANDAMGVGLFRSEFIYLDSKDYPTEDEQFNIYKSAVEKALGKRVVIRTLDIGADKQVEYFDMPKEENPALGVRAIRICLSRPGLFKTQLRALYRASAFGKIAIMFPMITTLEEVKKIKSLCEETQEELAVEKIPFNENTEIGIMIETPAAAIISDILAKEVDFFSIGTNDLTQYTLAVDRQNPNTEPFCDTHHQAILRLIKLVIDNSHKEGIWTGICGELAADMTLTELFLAMGVDELSVSPGQILPLKQKILETDVSKIKDKLLSRI